MVDGYLQGIPEEEEEKIRQVKRIVHDLEDTILRNSVLETGRRFDGRRLDEIRPIEVTAGVLPRTHGSALFTRRDAQIIEQYSGESLQKFMLHYNFPPFCVGEVKWMRGPGRREIGHGVLARRALTPVLPHEDDFPYTIRLVSDILESNGSSSMATVCGGSLALFDVGVPMLAPVAGVAMGLVIEGDQVVVLTDILGDEDHLGDMDFKVTGTRDGVTGFQMDVKISGISKEIMTEALEQARKARLKIIDIMDQTISEPKSEISPFAPKIVQIKVPTDKIREIIGQGGKMIRHIQDTTGAKIDIDDDGAAVDQASGDAALEMINQITAEAELDKVYMGKVRSIVNFGAFVEILPGKDGLLHISEIDNKRIEHVEDVLELGQQLEVKVIGIDREGKIRLSRKVLL